MDDTDVQERIATLNDNQRRAFDTIICSMNDDEAEHIFFFIDGPGGSGKIYLYYTLVALCTLQGRTVLSYATTGIAADLLKDGGTAHSGFCLPAPIILETSVSSMRIPSEK